MNLALLDNDFLTELFEKRDRVLYARIIALDINDNPLETLEGVITDGSVNVDGSSTVRRTCSLSMISDNVDIRDYYWGLKTKFKLEVGVENHISDKYEDLIWFPMGVFIANSFNTSLSLNNRTISISGKDKMCMLNGELGGQLFASIDFGTEETAITKINKVDTSGYKDSSFLSGSSYYVEHDWDDSQNRTSTEMKSIYTNDGYYYVESYKVQGEDDAVISTPERTFIITQINPDVPETYNSFNKFYWKDSSNVYHLIEDVITAEVGSTIFNGMTMIIPATYEENGQKKFSECAKKHGIYVFLIRFSKPEDVFKEGAEDDALKYEKSQYGSYYTLAGTTTIPTTGGGNDHPTTYRLTDLYEKQQEFEIKKIPLEKIIRESVHAYALEPYHNIIINDLEDYGLEQLTYIGDEPLYAFRETGSTTFQQLALESMLNSDILGEIEKPNFVFDSLSNDLVIDGGASAVEVGEKNYNVAKITYGMDVGYRMTDLVYTGELISNIGDSLTSVLDKIKTMLGDFEYFYDIEGRFVFQRQKTYVNTAWSQFIDNEDEKYVNYALDNSDVAFSLEGNRLISQISKTPNLTNLRNDFIVWGKRTSPNGAEIPIHARYAIDKKPTKYTTLGGEEYTSDKYDWRELIYQMALDYFGGQGCSPEKPYYELTSPDDFLVKVAEKNPELYPTGYTGYEQYYIDMEGFWRQLYNPDYVPIAKKNNDAGYVQKYIGVDGGFYAKYWEWENATSDGYEIDYYTSTSNIPAAASDDLAENVYCTNGDRKGWNVAVFEAPETLNFWIDFLDSGDELSQFQIPLIGDRQKVVKEDKATSIIFKEIPNLIMVDSSNQAEVIESTGQTGFVSIYVPKSFLQYLTISYRSVSVKDKIDELLYKHGYCSESVSITALPVYTLQPNTIIQVSDSETKIEGKYVVNKITLPLGYNKTMSISASKVPERLY